MKYEELKRMITESTPDDWAVLPEGPLYLDRLSEVIEGGGQHYLEVGSHHSLAVYRPDVSLRLA